LRTKPKTVSTRSGSKPDAEDTRYAIRGTPRIGRIVPIQGITRRAESRLIGSFRDEFPVEHPRKHVNPRAEYSVLETRYYQRACGRPATN
jgi:hypothetical protein